MHLDSPSAMFRVGFSTLYVFIHISPASRDQKFEPRAQLVGFVIGSQPYTIEAKNVLVHVKLQKYPLSVYLLLI